MATRDVEERERRMRNVERKLRLNYMYYRLGRV